jgi:hypothetical protein
MISVIHELKQGLSIQAMYRHVQGHQKENSLQEDLRQNNMPHSRAKSVSW